ncbi:Uncharacterised protein [Mycobacterium tuberculosis]|uniref:Uncharacterized protein n=2 Tax=Mycobacterium tuberculosis TaxID=1773 RepID=A0A654TPQ6_MYCTX|nr:Uncharacterised protein [Mycobacterium tuberculosis]CKR41760.1 Uncharacterised protein [Mycobacterium tuberculosis]CKS71235.1 Uncharacterised protein [Mycobacterium tuberculosis]COV20778.1 Uncharacterised protein [Mycobacterium tuberculosis]
MAGVHVAQAWAMKQPAHGHIDESRVDQQRSELVGIELAGVEWVDRGIAAGGKGDPVGGGHHQQSRAPQYPGALANESGLIPQMLDDLEVDHDVYRRVGQWQLGQVCLHHLHSGIAAPDMGHRSLVVVHRDDLASDAGDQVGAISLAAAGFQHVAGRAAGCQPLVDDLVAAKPVVLDVQIGDGALAGQRQHRRASRGGRRRVVASAMAGNVGNECAHC